MDPADLIDAHRYAEAAAICESRIRRDPGDLAALAGHAEAVLCLGRFEEALAEFRVLNENERVPGAPVEASQRYLKKIGAIFWLLGKRNEAIKTFRAATDGILEGTIRFADRAGGVSQGLLLWYASVTTHNDASINHALKYLRNREKRKAIVNWPGPISQYILHSKMRKPELLFAEATGACELDAAIERARINLLKRRQLVQALFYVGVQHRAEGSEKSCREWLQRCANLENPITEPEWYLACGELATAAAT